MASSSKFISILFLLAFFSIQIHARQFFNKVSSIDNNNSENTTEEPVTVVPRKQQPNNYNPEGERQEREPSFYAQTEGGYGLFGRDSDELTSETTTGTTSKGTYKPYVTPVRYHPHEPYNAMPSNNNNQKQNFEEARFAERNTYNNNNEAHRNEKQNFGLGEARFAERNTYNNNGYENTVSERQGMSDTRFLENGKYYYDINSERNSEKYPESVGDSRARHVVYNNNGGAGGRYYGNLQGRNNYKNQDFEGQQFDDEP